MEFWGVSFCLLVKKRYCNFTFIFQIVPILAAFDQTFRKPIHKLKAKPLLIIETIGLAYYPNLQIIYIHERNHPTRHPGRGKGSRSNWTFRHQPPHQIRGQYSHSGSSSSRRKSASEINSWQKLGSKWTHEFVPFWFLINLNSVFCLWRKENAEWRILKNFITWK